MTPEKIIEMAKQAGMNKLPGKWDGWSCHLDELQAFAQLVRNAALEEASVICDELQAVPATEPRHCSQDIRGLKS